MSWNPLFDEFVSRMRSHAIPLRLQLWNGSHFDLAPDPQVTITANSIGSLRHIIHPTLDNLGKAYVEGDIDVSGPVMDVVDVAARLASANGPAERPSARTTRHTKELDKESIHYHYDVSNEFYQQWLDKEMIYSCAYFKTADDTLDAAQEQKLDHILAKLNIRPGQTLLDIGCGWGALIIRAARKYGIKTLGVTLSQNQYDYAKARIEQEGLSDLCEVRVQDYRDVSGQFDRITSVGMFEHVGLDNLQTYFNQVKNLLVDGGVALNHGITSTDPDSKSSPFGGGDFIDRYVFPNGELPHISLALREMAAAGLEVLDVENLRRHYALTLEHWAQRFDTAKEKVLGLAGDQRYRIWRIYLAGCAYGFRQDWIALHQILATKSGGPDLNKLPLTRDYMYRPR